VDEARLDADRAQALQPEAVVQSVEVGRQARLAGAVDHRLAARAVPGHRAEHAQRTAAFAHQVRAGVLAEGNRVGKVGGQQLAGPVGVRLQLLLGAEPGSGDDDHVDAAESFGCPVERAGEARGIVEIAAAGARGPPAGGQIGRRALQLLGVAAEQVEPVAARGQQPGEGAPHSPCCTEQYHSHAATSG